MRYDSIVEEKEKTLNQASQAKLTVNNDNPEVIERVERVENDDSQLQVEAAANDTYWIDDNFLTLDENATQESQELIPNYYLQKQVENEQIPDQQRPQRQRKPPDRFGNVIVY